MEKASQKDPIFTITVLEIKCYLSDFFKWGLTVLLLLLIFLVVLLIKLYSASVHKKVTNLKLHK